MKPTPYESTLTSMSKLTVLSFYFCDFCLFVCLFSARSGVYQSALKIPSATLTLISHCILCHPCSHIFRENLKRCVG